MTVFLSRRARRLLTSLTVAIVFSCGAVTAASARSAPKKDDEKADTSKQKDRDGKAKSDKKSTEIGQFGEWGAYQTQGAKKTCYALAKPKSREPEAIKRDAAYIFISYRPAENVKNEISIIMGFPMKDGGDATAVIGDAEFGLIAKGSNAWVKNPAEESHFIEAMKKGSKLVVKAASIKGKVSTDTYSLSGLSQALEKARKECP